MIGGIKLPPCDVFFSFPWKAEPKVSADNDADEVKLAEFEEQISNFHRMKMKKSRLSEGQHSIRLEAALTKGT